MQIMVNDIPINDAVNRARTRFEELDSRMARAYEAGNPARAPVGAGALATLLGVSALLGVWALPSATATLLGIVALITGGALLGYGIPRWREVRGELRGISRHWDHALKTLRLRESQAEDDPHQTVEVLTRMDGRDPLVSSLHYGARLWASSMGAGRYPQ
jgi:hypothetical protein